MAYAKFSLEEAVRQFGLRVEQKHDLFPSIAPVVPGAFFQEARRRLFPLGLAIGSEKARSEFLIAPLLVEVQAQADPPLSLFSGINFDVEPEHGLNGFCDCLLSGSEQQFYVDAPVLAIVEAKDENIRSGLGQCAATLVAAQRFNARRELPGTIYGAVTTGNVWRFLKLDGTTLSIDHEERFLAPVENLLGILLLVTQGNARAAS